MWLQPPEDAALLRPSPSLSVVEKKWTALVPTRTATLLPSGKLFGRSSSLRFIGKLPEDAWCTILQSLSVPDVAATALCCRRLAILSRDSRIWKAKLDLLAFKGLGAARNVSRSRESTQGGASETPVPRKPSIPSIKVEHQGEDDFGSFTRAPRGKDDLMMLFDDEEEDDMGGFSISPPGKRPPPEPIIEGSVAALHINGEITTPRDAFIAQYQVLKPYFRSLRTHTTSSLVFTTPHLSPLDRAHLLATLARLLWPPLLPTLHPSVISDIKRNLQSASDFFEGTMLAEFEAADGRRDEAAMKRVAEIAWELNGGASVVQVFVGKREIFYDPVNHDPLKNLTKLPGQHGEIVDGIDFSAMDGYMRFILNVVKREGTTIARVFPSESDVLIDFADRIASDVMSDYIMTLLSAAQSLQNPLFLLATAAAFAQALRLVDTILSIEPKSPLVTRERAEDVVYRMFEIHMDDYLSEEGEWTREVLEAICNEWDKKLESESAATGSTFLASRNPDAVKRNVMGNFKKALLLPVTIVPKTMAYSLNAIGSGAFLAVSAIGSGVQAVGAGIGLAPASSPGPLSRVNSYSTTRSVPMANSPSMSDSREMENRPVTPPSEMVENGTNTPQSQTTGTTAKADPFARMQLLLSLDTALQLVQADRDCLKRVQTFSGYPGLYGQKVRDATEEVFLILLQTLADQHLVPAFRRATTQMNDWQPEEHEGDANVAPLVQFFELVHIGDTIGQMIQAYYDKEMAGFIDRTDFLNVVVREKKKFEMALDDSVATGLNAGVQLLMGHVEHIVTIRQDARDFCPPDDAELDLQPTDACKAAVTCLRTHCDMLKGSTDKQILEVFYVEIGLRLHGIILKHLKRAIVSPQGGFRVIADLNHYHAFITSLRQAQLVPYFAGLKMVANLYIVDSPKDLAGLVKDVQRYEGTLRGEDAYELLQRRTDWAKLQKQTDKLLYGLSTEDCVIS